MLKYCKFQGVPWEPIPGREGIEVRANIELPMEETEPTPVQEPEPQDVIRRRAGITKTDIEKYGMTPGCHGCVAQNRGRRGNHTEECRKRMEGFMARGKDSRIDRYATRVAVEAERMVRKTY